MIRRTIASPKLTVGISFKNPGRHFSLSLKSVFRQSFQDWELLLVDDGSDDGSLELARSLRDERVRVVSDGQCHGLAPRLNQMAAMAEGEYFVRMDADDVMDPDRLKVQYGLLKADCDGSVFGSTAYSIDKESRVLGLKKTSFVQRRGYQARHSFHHPTVAAPTAWFRSNPYDESLQFWRAEDAELWCRTSSSSVFRITTEPLLFYREPSPFSLPNYVSSSLGLIQVLCRHYRRPRWRFLGHAAVEAAKLSIAIVAEALEESDRIVQRRIKPLSTREQEEVQGRLDAIGQTVLPT